MVKPSAVLVSVAVLAASLVPTETATATATAAVVKPALQAADDSAHVTATNWLAPQQFDITVQSPALGGQSVQVRILVPRDWTPQATRTWPVLYAFHGGNDNYTSWTRNSDIADLAAKYEVIVVMPEGGGGSYTDWYNYGKGGVPKWETFHTTELLQLIQRDYHGSTVRAAIGDSAGGEGAVTYAERHPGLFRYVASLSGPLSIRIVGVQETLLATNIGLGRDPLAIWGVPIVDDANWQQHDPDFLASRLRGTGIFFSSGTTGRPGPGDPDVAPWDIGLLSEEMVGRTDLAFKARLDALHIPYTADIYGDGRHAWPAWIRETHKIWPTLMKSLGAAPV